MPTKVLETYTKESSKSIEEVEQILNHFIRNGEKTTYLHGLMTHGDMNDLT